MGFFTVLLLAASILFSTLRAVFSKTIGASEKNFDFFQSILFFIAAAVVLIINIKTVSLPNIHILLMSLFYGAFTVVSQNMYTKALTKAPVSVCAMIYSFGFIIPTVFGTIKYNESINTLKIISIILCVFTIMLSSVKKTEHNIKLEGIPITVILAMLASGGLGVVQKIQQKSSESRNVGTFLFISFLLAGAFSLLLAHIKKNKFTLNIQNKKLISAVFVVGISMAAANTVNTLIAGALPSTIAFPITNVGVILASLVVSVIIIKEKITKSQIFAFVSGVSAILLLNL